jgi:uroporphyrinogen decarboxylase
MKKALEKTELVEKNYQGHKKYIESFHPDFVKIMSDGFFTYIDPAAVPVKEIKDLKKIPALDKNHPWIQKQVELVKRIIALQKDTAYFYNIFSPSSLLKIAIGNEKYLAFFKEDPKALAQALKVIARSVAVQAEQVITQGTADGIYYSVQNPDLKIISDKDYKKYISPSDLFVLKAANRAGKNNLLHICGYEGVRNHLETWSSYKVKAYNWAVHVEGVSPARGKEIFGGKAVIGGFANISGSLIHKGSKKEIEDFTEKLIRENGKTGFLIGADCTIPSDTSLEHLEWVRSKAASL